MDEKDLGLIVVNPDININRTFDFVCSGLDGIAGGTSDSWFCCWLFESCPELSATKALTCKNQEH